MFEAPGGVGGGGIDLSSSSIGSSYSQSHSRSDWTDPAWEANALQALGPALPPPPPPPPPRVGSPTDDATASASASAASASAAAQAAAQAVMVPYIEALLRLPPQLRRHPPALTRSPSKSHHQAAPLSPTRSSSSSSNTSAAITATVLDCHHRHHPLGQAALRFLLYLEEAYAAAPTADNPDNTDTDPQKQDADDEEEADYPLLLDGMATDVSRFLTYMEAGLRLAWPRLAATRWVGGQVYWLGRVLLGGCLSVHVK